MMETDQQKAEAEINAILRDKTHPLHEKFHRSDPQTIEHMNKLWSQTSPPPEPTPPGPAPTPQTGGTSAKGQPEIVDPGASLGEKSQADMANERKLAEQHLIESLGPAEAGTTVKDAREVFGRLFEKGNAGDQAFLTNITNIEESIGNDPEVIVHLAGLKEKLAGLGPSLDAQAVSRMPQQEKLGRAVSAAVALFGSLDSPLVKRLEKLFPDEASQVEAVNWLASKNFR